MSDEKKFPVVKTAEEAFQIWVRGGGVGFDGTKAEFERFEEMVRKSVTEGAPRMATRTFQANQGYAPSLVMHKPHDCDCHLDCRQDSMSGTWHQHADEPCPVHPYAPVVG